MTRAWTTVNVAWCFLLYFMHSRIIVARGVSTFFLAFAASLPSRRPFNSLCFLATTAGSDFCFILLLPSVWDTGVIYVLFSYSQVFPSLTRHSLDKKPNFSLHDLTTQRTQTLRLIASIIWLLLKTVFNDQGQHGIVCENGDGAGF